MADKLFSKRESYSLICAHSIEKIVAFDLINTSEHGVSSETKEESSYVTQDFRPRRLQYKIQDRWHNYSSKKKSYFPADIDTRPTRWTHANRSYSAWEWSWTFFTNNNKKLMIEWKRIISRGKNKWGVILETSNYLLGRGIVILKHFNLTTHFYFLWSRFFGDFFFEKTNNNNHQIKSKCSLLRSLRDKQIMF